ncbi:cupin 2 barrel domain-containing partial [Nannochloropsis oceanica]
MLPLLLEDERRGARRVVLPLLKTLGLLLVLLLTITSQAAAITSTTTTVSDGSCSAASTSHAHDRDENHKNGVGSRVLHEDDQIKVWEMILQPGELAPLHTHEYPYTFIVESGSTVEVRGAEEEHLLTFTAHAGEVLSFNLIGDELVDPTGQYRLNKSHSARNIGASIFKEMLIEKKTKQ